MPTTTATIEPTTITWTPYHVATSAASFGGECAGCGRNCDHIAHWVGSLAGEVFVVCGQPCAQKVHDEEHAVLDAAAAYRARRAA